MGLVLRRVAARVAAPVEQFLATQAAGGIMLLVAAAAALIWANVDHASYAGVWHTELTLGIGVGPFEPMTKDLHFWVNDLLMTFFFMLAGFEIKREMAEGELSDRQRAMLPVGAAIGGMLVPAAIYFAFNSSGPTVDGWGVPMATDIAFALGLLALLGNRVPAALRILLLALAIIDDLGAILVIAIFYTPSLGMEGLAVAGGGVGILILFRMGAVRPGLIYLIPLMVIWQGLYWASVHPTLAGVIVGMAAPTRPYLAAKEFIDIANKAVRKFGAIDQKDRSDHHVEEKLVESMREVGAAGREAVSPVVRLQNQFAPWVAFVIMPLFALANAGVELGGVSLSTDASLMAFTGVSLGLAVGKPLGVLVFTWLMVKTGLCRLPKGISWASILVLGLMAGIGFTMSIFISDLAFRGQDVVHDVSKLAILVATAFAAIGGLLLGRFVLPKQSFETASVSAQDAERSTEY